MSTQPSDDIDLYTALHIIRKRYAIVISVFVAFTAFIGILSFFITPLYRSSMSVRKPLTDVRYPIPLESVIARINELRKSSQISTLAKKLAVSEREAVALSSVTSRELRDGYTEITLTAEYPQLIPKLGRGIVAALNSDAPLRESLKAQRNRLASMQQEINSTMQEYEQLRGSIRPPAQQATGERELHVARITIAVAELKAKSAEIDRGMRLLDGFEIAIEPMVPEKPFYPNHVLNIVVAGITSVILGVLLAFLKEWYDIGKRRASCR